MNKGELYAIGGYVCNARLNKKTMLSGKKSIQLRVYGFSVCFFNTCNEKNIYLLI